MAPKPTSPLLCPRRTFLTTLILASKFSQDKCYSNCAWAKLSGLPPREIGCCERVLGHALDWRLWVGKKALTSAPVAPSHAIVRTQSDPIAHRHPRRSDLNFKLIQIRKLRLRVLLAVFRPVKDICARIS